MAKQLIQIVILAVLALPAHAGQGTIQETDTQIIIEYSGGEEGSKETKAQEIELEKQRKVEEIKNKEEKLKQTRMEKALRKGARRGAFVTNDSY